MYSIADAFPITTQRICHWLATSALTLGLLAGPSCAQMPLPGPTHPPYPGLEAAMQRIREESLRIEQAKREIEEKIQEIDRSLTQAKEREKAQQPPAPPLPGRR